MRKQALLPIGPDEPMPYVYSMWDRCKQWNTLWWQGGIAAQPHVLMAEFNVCDKVTQQFQSYNQDIAKFLKDSSGI